MILGKEKKVDKEKKEADEIEIRPHCKMKICEDPETGDIIVVADKNCPPGYIQKIAGKVAVRGVRFRQEKDDDEEE